MKITIRHPETDEPLHIEIKEIRITNIWEPEILNNLSPKSREIAIKQASEALMRKIWNMQATFNRLESMLKYEIEDYIQ